VFRPGRISHPPSVTNHTSPRAARSAGP
jgi:hypothetical protein